MYLLARNEAAKLVNDNFKNHLEDTAGERFSEQTCALVSADRNGNIGGYVPTLTAVACEQLRASIEILGQIYASEFTYLSLPCDPETELDVERTALLLAGATAASVRGRLSLFETRTRKYLNIPAGIAHIQRAIAASANTGLKRAKSTLRRQRIKFGRPEGLSAIGLCQQIPKERERESIVRQEGQKVMHHATKPPLAYPGWRYHGIKPGKIVKDAAEDAALGPGWVHTPDAFSWTNFKDRVWTQQHPDPLRWSGEWLGASLDDRVRDSIKAQLLKAHSLFLRLSAGSVISAVPEERISKPFAEPPVNPDAYQEVMKHAFSGIAGVLHTFRLLRTDHLTSEIPTFVSDAAVAGGWWPRPASEASSSAYSEQYGRYWFCGGCGHSQLIDKIFEPIVMEWTGTLLEAAAESLPVPKKTLDETKAGRSKSGNSKYKQIDSVLKKIADARPKDHHEVFQSLDSRNIRVADSEPFRSAGSWLAGVKKDPPTARAWLSKRWSTLRLPAFSRGPKK